VLLFIDELLRGKNNKMSSPPDTKSTHSDTKSTHSDTKSAPPDSESAHRDAEPAPPDNKDELEALIVYLLFLGCGLDPNSRYMSAADVAAVVFITEIFARMADCGFTREDVIASLEEYLADTLPDSRSPASLVRFLETVTVRRVISALHHLGL